MLKKIKKEQLIDAINSARNLIKTRLVDPQQLPADKKMVELIDDLIQQKISMSKLTPNDLLNIFLILF